MDGPEFRGAIAIGVLGREIPGVFGIRPSRLFCAEVTAGESGSIFETSFVVAVSIFPSCCCFSRSDFESGFDCNEVRLGICASATKVVLLSILAF